MGINERKGAALLVCVLVAAAVAAWVVGRWPAQGAPEENGVQASTAVYGGDEESAASGKRDGRTGRKRGVRGTGGRRKSSTAKDRASGQYAAERDILSDTIPTAISAGIPEEDCP